ncbi:MAG: hypothetical protein HY001_03455 [Candidatus Portnoybacteria bacterium]|nr:hypothetical protein [Candidatus Portnoybacteria bacterium]
MKGEDGEQIKVKTQELSQLLSQIGGGLYKDQAPPQESGPNINPDDELPPQDPENPENSEEKKE